ncbi:hypothetical protein LEP1GSC171_1540 [Leptospira santarosai str. HAI1380]|uniref:Uncharacterized protein n=1 Tax=Leptospira santarosai str. ZUN179 TaxID=1049985 RepID=M6ULR0_9LEPT|nr:hypothetical protein LEP1GSC187_3188 [Leptospira santarosai str. ZUN179]EMP03812.1 hypothetical protein LEP1GSC171_1540 [Leptospira santarosai str. HAI1380]
MRDCKEASPSARKVPFSNQQNFNYQTLTRTRIRKTYI